jgi:hypothetical protein
MTTDLAERRRGRALSLFVLAAALAVVAAITVAIEYRSTRSEGGGGPVLPGLEATIDGAERITVTSADATYRIERVERGSERVWVMRDRDDYPVLASRLAQLTQGLESLTYARRMTSDASRHERLGVTDPREGGRGILLTIEDGRGALPVNIILGVEQSGIYVRQPDSDQTWSVTGELPPLRDPAAWMDLRPLEVSADQIARVEVTPPEGRAYVLTRDGADAPWRVVVPALGSPAGASLSSVAEALSALDPVDVRTAPAIQGPVRARLRALTFEGVAIEGELIESDERLWLKLIARPGAPEQEGAAQAINDRSAGWAYALSDLDVGALVPALASLLPGE